ncbi:MAG: 3-oxoacid CoA-transferase [Peptococcaceae bacterium]
MENGAEKGKEFYSVINKRFVLPKNEGINKVYPLKEAVKKYIKPQMKIHITQTGVRWPTAAIFEIARQFWGTKPKFTLIGISMNHPQAILVHGGLVKKLITTYCGDPYFTPAPNGVYQRAYLNNQIEIENWTILTLPLRLKAAAMGLPVAVTKSIIGSSMAKENKGAFLVGEDPFGTGGKVGIMRALYPDLSIVHGWVADCYGNTILLPPLAENTYGAMASKKGAIVTVEKIVDTDYIRKNAHLVALPGDYVRCVSEAPLGAHPAGLTNVGLPDFPTYAEDYEFVNEARLAAKSPEDFDKWINKWVLSCRNHETYLKKLGTDRILALKGKSHSDAWNYDFSFSLEDNTSKPYTPLEMALVAGARKLREKIKAKNYHTILAGAGIANLSAWLGYYDLKNEGCEVALMAEVGLYGYSPRPFDPALFNQRNFYTCKALTDSHHVMGIYMGGFNNRCIGVIGFGEVDRYGNINTTKIPGQTYIAGSGGANDIASSAQEILAVGTQHKSRFLEKVTYVTSPGKKVMTLVSDLGIFEKLPGDEEFTLTACLPDKKSSSLPEHINKIKKNCGWELRIKPDVKIIAPPSQEELITLRIFDPRHYFLKP